MALPSTVAGFAALAFELASEVASGIETSYCSVKVTPFRLFAGEIVLDRAANLRARLALVGMRGPSCSGNQQQACAGALAGNFPGSNMTPGSDKGYPRLAGMYGSCL